MPGTAMASRQENATSASAALVPHTLAHHEREVPHPSHAPKDVVLMGTRVGSGACGAATVATLLLGACEAANLFTVLSAVAEARVGRRKR